MALRIIIIIIAVLCSTSSAYKNTSFSFPKFVESDHTTEFEFLGGDSSIDLGALQLTPDSRNDAVLLLNKSGRIFYHKPFTLWRDHKNGTVLASFNSTFLINMFREEGWTAGEGLAFLIAPNTSIPSNSHGQYLGLTNASTDGNPENKIVAVEFDTYKQDGLDPDDNHVGLDINSVDSVKTETITAFQLSPPNATKYAAWVDYDGPAQRIRVYMANENDSKPEEPLLNEPLNLREFVARESYFGFAGSTGSPQIQLNCVLRWSLTVEGIEKDNSRWVKIGAGVGAAAAVLGLCGACYVAGRCVRERRRKGEEEAAVAGELSKLPDMARVFRYKELKTATNSFSEGMVLGQGGFGIVYRGLLADAGGEIAVKKFSRDDIKGKDDFFAELAVIHRLRHKNLVRLVGWCYEQGKLFLVYDYMPNGSLDKHLYRDSNHKTLTWPLRYTILSGVASALNYLHNGYYQKVLHRDLKPSNIMLDKDFSAVLGDFGLARALDNEQNSYAELGLVGAQGTMGYVAPECFHEGRATPESDLFGFGAVALEVVCGRHPVIKIKHGENEYSLIDWVWMLHREGRIEEAVDERLLGDFDVDEAKRLLFLGLACCHPIASERPKTNDVYQIMMKAAPVPYVPPFRPVFTWPSMGVNGNGSESGIGFSEVTLTTSADDESRSAGMLNNDSARLL